MSRIALILAPLLIVIGFAGSAVGAVTDGFEAQFTQHLGRGIGAASRPCTVAFCGSGWVVGYGEAELTIIATSTSPTSLPGCGFALAVTGSAMIALQDGSTLLLDEAGTSCLPGESHFAPGNLFVSYGNPVEIDATYTVIGGSGVFVGATGAGATTIYQAGDTQMAIYSGTLTFG